MGIHFEFLKTEWASVYEAAAKAESLAYPDPRAACFYSRRALELAVTWLFECDDTLTQPYKTELNAFLSEPSFRSLVGTALHAKLDIIRKLGNRAVHDRRPIRPEDAIPVLRELFHFCYWLGRNYGLRPTDKPDPKATFNPDQLPKTSPIPPQTQEQLKKQAEQLATKDAQVAELTAINAALDTEVQQLRQQVAQAKLVNAAQPDPHDYNEAATRDLYIDVLLKEAGWALDQPRDREFPVQGMPNASGDGFVDYVLWGDNGKPLALVEAKRTRRDPQEGEHQAKLYADCLEQQFGQRPIIFYTNGYTHWLWDDTQYPPRQVQGFFKKAELELLIQRRTTRRSLLTAEIDTAIAGRYYQTRAIRRISEAFERHHDRKALVVMATGAGKTRTVIALCDLLMRCNWVKRVLFLADRVALVNQTVNAFKKHLPASSPVNLVTEKNTEGRVYVCTYPSMMGLINNVTDDQRKFSVGHFDLIVIDEAHRSVYQKYRTIFEYFDALLVGLTATPKDEIDRNTYSLFNVQPGSPTDFYPLDDAVKDGYLVPVQSVSVPLKFQREGIRYADLPEAEREQWDELEWDEEGNVPDRVEATAVNQWLFNEDTVDKVLAHLMTRGLKVAGDDRLGKTIIFAKNNPHAQFIYDRFNANYPHYRGEFARIITHKTEYAQNLIDNFSHPEKMPHIAISVDMLDTGIDVPEVVNLVFFKLVRSRTKFWQMIGRGTRLRPDLFGRKQDKEFFYLFDYCQNLEFFSQNLEPTEGSVSPSLSKRLFTTRLDLLAELDKHLPNIGAGNDSAGTDSTTTIDPSLDPTTEVEVRQAISTQLHTEVNAMNLDNFIVRPKRQMVETYTQSTAWNNLQPGQLRELADHIAGLPTDLPTENEEAKRFDLLMLRLQLARLRAEPKFIRLSQQVQEIAAALEEQERIPSVAEQMELIQEIQTEAWWQDVTIPMLERVRKRLRSLVRLVEKTQRQPIYTNFEDELGPETLIEIPSFGSGSEFDRFRAKARQFLLAHEDHITIHKLRFNQPLTATDLSELERILLESGIGTPENLEYAKATSEGLGLFIRSLVGLNREAAKQAFGQFLSGSTVSADQIEFINLIIDHLTHHGTMNPGLLYESPFTDINAQGPEGVFSPQQVDGLISLLEDIRAAAAA
ncbi:DEAD/DEAH box helicase family protein [Leptolyngbya sp. GGD]|uniref:DEAD/DEAH box helicase family protein n=1 Tax=Leptolyngbya sp. GGD TaxID=2997907 RepID=UPI00227A46C0|nr:DEAD/DEAH box helicase family protein [Leptolyngbya sp. GGD]MCY6494578.1 DEAD/DEAH box helicase family protein [Leptolyngbya sp. GGD]